MVGMQSMPGNPYDGHTLAETLEQVGILTGTDCNPHTAVVDRGYRGVQIDGVRIFMSGQKRGITRTLKAIFTVLNLSHGDDFYPKTHSDIAKAQARLGFPELATPSLNSRWSAIQCGHFMRVFKT